MIRVAVAASAGAPGLPGIAECGTFDRVETRETDLQRSVSRLKGLPALD
jgi:hypothetical protein